jgi:hypothetical protein
MLLARAERRPRFSISSQPKAGALDDRHNQCSPWPDLVRGRPRLGRRLCRPGVAPRSLQTIDFSQPDTGERRLAIADRLARVIPDERDADRIVHLLPDISPPWCGAGAAPYFCGSAPLASSRATNSCTTSLSASASRRGSGGGAATPALCSTSIIMSISILVARIRARRYVEVDFIAQACYIIKL